MVKSIYSKFAAVMLALIVVISFLWVGSYKLQKDTIPSFSRFENIVEKKEAFIGYFSKKVKEINGSISISRQKLFILYGEYTLANEINFSDRNWLKLLAKSYGMDDFDFENKDDWIKLIKRVDIVPVSMAVAQAAVESGWGTSRFAREGNNFFGIWCYTKGCGMVPIRRVKGLEHEVKSYKTAEDGIKDFIYILNSKPVYERFRELRYQQRKDGGKLTGSILITSLLDYSAIGKKYIEIIQDVIEDNKLE